MPRPSHTNKMTKYIIKILRPGDKCSNRAADRQTKLDSDSIALYCQFYNNHPSPFIAAAKTKTKEFCTPPLISIMLPLTVFFQSNLPNKQVDKFDNLRVRAMKVSSSSSSGSVFVCRRNRVDGQLMCFPHT